MAHGRSCVVVAYWAAGLCFCFSARLSSLCRWNLQGPTTRCEAWGLYGYLQLMMLKKKKPAADGRAAAARSCTSPDHLLIRLSFVLSFVLFGLEFKISYRNFLSKFLCSDNIPNHLICEYVMMSAEAGSDVQFISY
jgi:hypothetical protein